MSHLLALEVPPWIEETLRLSLSLSHAQQLGLAFLLGSFAVATWSDLKHLAAQREFLEVWLLILFGALALDVYETRRAEAWGTFAVKWGLIALLSALSWRRVGLLFKLALGDVAALAVAACMLSPALIVILYGVAKLLALGLEPVLRRGRPFWPFMPVVSLATLAVLALGLLL
jgi:hypothetical protein